MNAAKYLCALWTGILIYATLSVFFGSKGLSAQLQLEREKERQETNIIRLIEINRELENSMNSLLYDTDTLAVYAREQGFAAGSERFVRIVGLGTGQRVRTYPGSIVAVAQPQFTSDQTIRLISLGTAIAILVCLAIFDILRFLKDRQNRLIAD